MKIIALLFAVIAVSALLMKMRSKARKPKSPATAIKVSGKARAVAGSKTAAVAPRNPYRATSIVFDDTACEAVKALGNKQFLERDRDVPRLPLADCSKSRCGCKYAHHDDRRESSEDRRHPSGLKAELYERGLEQNKRKKKRGRRKSDWG